MISLLRQLRKRLTHRVKLLLCELRIIQGRVLNDHFMNPLCPTGFFSVTIYFKSQKNLRDAKHGPFDWLTTSNAPKFATIFDPE